MNTHADQATANKSKSVANAVPEKENIGDAAMQVVDNRHEAIAQRKLQEAANNSQQVSQLKAVQDMANNSPQAKYAAQLKSMANGVVQRYPPNGLKVHSHFEERMGDHSISKATVDDIVTSGSAYDDTGMPGATIYYKGGIAVVYDGSQLKTCYPGKVKSRWVKK